MDNFIPKTPKYLSEISFNRRDPITVKLVWDDMEGINSFHPILHLFYGNGNRVDLVSEEKRSTQGAKLLKNESSYLIFELDMKKLPRYVDSMYISICSKSKEFTGNNFNGMHALVTQEEITEEWYGTKLIGPISSATVVSFVRNKPAGEWSMRFHSEAIPPNFERIKSVLTKTDLFYLPNLVPTKSQRLVSYLINLCKKLNTKFLK